MKRFHLNGGNLSFYSPRNQALDHLAQLSFEWWQFIILFTKESSIRPSCTAYTTINSTKEVVLRARCRVVSSENKTSSHRLSLFQSSGMLTAGVALCYGAVISARTPATYCRSESATLLLFGRSVLNMFELKLF